MPTSCLVKKQEKNPSIILSVEIKVNNEALIQSCENWFFEVVPFRFINRGKTG